MSSDSSKLVCKPCRSRSILDPVNGPRAAWRQQKQFYQLLRSFKHPTWYILTFDAKLFASPQQAFDFFRTNGCISRLLDTLRKNVSGLKYIWVVEFHKSEFPHINLIIDSVDDHKSLLERIWNNFGQELTPPASELGLVKYKPVESSEDDAVRISTYLTKQFRDHNFPDWLLDYEERTLRMFGNSQNATTQANAKRRTRTKKKAGQSQSTPGKKRRNTRTARSYRVAQAEISQRVEVLRQIDDSKMREYSANISFEQVKELLGKYRTGSEMEISEAEMKTLIERNVELQAPWHREVRQQLVSQLTPLLDEHLDLAILLAEEDWIASRIEAGRSNRDQFAKSHSAVFAKAQANLLSLAVSALLPDAMVLSLRTEFQPVTLDQLRKEFASPDEDGVDAQADAHESI